LSKKEKQKINAEKKFLEDPYAKKGCCTRITFGWIAPLLRFTKANYSLNINHLELIKQEVMIENKIELLKSKWINYENNQARGDNALFKSILFAFWKDFLILVILNVVSTIMGL
jgi:hypothetical protein